MYIHTYVLIIFWDMNQLHCFFLQVLAFSEGWNATTIYNGTCSSYLVPKSWIMFKPLNLGKWPTSSLSSTPTCPAPRHPRPFRSDHRVGRLRRGRGSDECGGRAARAARLDLWRWTGEGEGQWGIHGHMGIGGIGLFLLGKFQQDVLIILICGFAPK
jgi:hypothetical protein